ncbi:MAG: hypothetical protein IK123_06490, partial [Lachnospiraceae bacterium]|nr:hypothetical protein [Lachnospiraceae bacterium]
AGIGGGQAGNGINISISGGTVNVTAGDNAYGIGRGTGYGSDSITISGGEVNSTGRVHGIGGQNATILINGGVVNSDIAGKDTTISGGRVIATGHPGSPGIGFAPTQGNTLVITEAAEVYVAGGAAGMYGSIPFGEGPAIGIGVIRQSGGTYGPSTDYIDDTDTSGLFTTGVIRVYSPGTTAASIRSNPETNLAETICGTVPAPVVVIPSFDFDNNDTDVEEQTSSVGYAAFLASSGRQVEDYLKKISAAIAAGNIQELNVLRAKGIKIEAGNWISFRKDIYLLIEQAVKMGVPVTVNFTYKGNAYSTTIPAYTKISPVSLCNEEGYCGFLNLIKNYGGTVRK